MVLYEDALQNGQHAAASVWLQSLEVYLWVDLVFFGIDFVAKWLISTTRRRAFSQLGGRLALGRQYSEITRHIIASISSKYGFSSPVMVHADPSIITMPFKVKDEAANATTPHTNSSSRSASAHGTGQTPPVPASVSVLNPFVEHTNNSTPSVRVGHPSFMVNQEFPGAGGGIYPAGPAPPPHGRGDPSPQRPFGLQAAQTVPASMPSSYGVGHVPSQSPSLPHTEQVVEEQPLGRGLAPHMVINGLGAFQPASGTLFGGSWQAEPAVNAQPSYADPVVMNLAMRP